MRVPQPGTGELLAGCCQNFTPEPRVLHQQPLLVSLFPVIVEGAGSSQINGSSSPLRGVTSTGGDSFHHTATPPSREAGMVLLWHMQKLSGHSSQQDRVPPMCGVD